MLVAVSHDKFLGLKKEDIGAMFNPEHTKKVFLDIKGLYNREDYLTGEYIYWRL